MRTRAPRSGSKSPPSRRCSCSRMGSCRWHYRRGSPTSGRGIRRTLVVTSLRQRSGGPWLRFLQVRLQILYDGTERLRRLGVRMFEDERFARIASDDDPRVQGNATQERKPELFRGRFAPADLEDVRLLAAMRADEAAHVLDDAQEVQLHGF